MNNVLLEKVIDSLTTNTVIVVNIKTEELTYNVAKLRAYEMEVNTIDKLVNSLTKYELHKIDFDKNLVTITLTKAE